MKKETPPPRLKLPPPTYMVQERGGGLDPTAFFIGAVIAVMVYLALNGYVT